MNALEIGLDALSDEELAALSQGKNEQAFADLVSRCSSMLKSLAVKYSGIIEADDLAQEGLLGLLSAAQTYHPSKAASFRTYAYACIRNRMISVLRQQSGQSDLSFVDEDEPVSVSDVNDPAAVLLRREELTQLYTRLQRELSEREYRVLMTHLSGYSYKEIAEQLSISEKAVDNALQRLRRKLVSSFS